MASTASSLSSSLAFLLLLLGLSPAAFSFRVPPPSLTLSYHHGRLLSGDEPIKLYITFYGEFGPSERSTLLNFLSSLTPRSSQEPRRSLRTVPRNIEPEGTPSVAKWWALTEHYRDIYGRHVSQKLEVRGERMDSYTMGRHLKSSDISALARSSARAFSISGSPNSVVLIFTSADVYVEGFCMHACGGHSYVQFSTEEEEENRNPNPEEGSLIQRVAEQGEGHKRREGFNREEETVLYAWVGNARLQCPGYCAWPFGRADYGPPAEPLKAPNDVGSDGMVITLAKVLVGTATNPFFSGYFQGAHLDGHNHFGTEASAACLGQFGAGSYPGHPGFLLYNPDTGASFNMEGFGGTQFLVPWIWNPATLSCSAQA